MKSQRFPVQDPDNRVGVCSKTLTENPKQFLPSFRLRNTQKQLNSQCQTGGVYQYTILVKQSGTLLVAIGTPNSIIGMHLQSDSFATFREVTNILTKPTFTSSRRSLLLSSRQQFAKSVEYLYLKPNFLDTRGYFPPSMPLVVGLQPFLRPQRRETQQESKLNY